MTTLRELHKKLKIKQTLDNYVRNTNKKYKYNFVADEILGEGMAKLIELNTQGKLGRHAQQIAYINHNLSLQRQKEQLEQANERLAKRAEKAQKLLDTELLKDSYIETLEMFSKFNSAKQYTMWDDLETPTKVIEFMEKNGVKQGKWLRPEGVEAWFKERIIWFAVTVFIPPLFIITIILLVVYGIYRLIIKRK